MDSVTFILFILILFVYCIPWMVILHGMYLNYKFKKQMNKMSNDPEIKKEIDKLNKEGW
jgi:hypothetical protein